MTHQEIYENAKKIYENRILMAKDRIEKLKSYLDKYLPTSYRYEKILQSIKDEENNLYTAQRGLEFVRPNNDIDFEYRMKIQKEFPQIVKNLFPDGYPIVFHGTKNIGIVREILKSGGLFTPDQRGISMQSQATQIDVTYKNNIRTTCDFAEPSPQSSLPFGAIFAFFPQKSEIDNVISTNENSSQVSGGVEGVSFRNEPDRLYAIITTPENLERVQAWCNEYGIDPSKVHTPKTFINETQNIVKIFFISSPL
jgi:hypothetical protein